MTSPLIQRIADLTSVSTYTLSRLHRLELITIQDLLWHLPIRYENRSEIIAIKNLKLGNQALICGQIQFAEIRDGRKKQLCCVISDNTGLLTLRFFHYHQAQLNSFKTGLWLLAFGEIRQGYQTWDMIHPDYQLAEKKQFKLDTELSPIYSTTEGLNQAILRKLTRQALNIAKKNLVDYLAQLNIKVINNNELFTELYQLHYPHKNTSEHTLMQARQRFAFEELLTHYLTLRSARHHIQQAVAPIFYSQKNLIQHFLRSLPFQLTSAQQRVIAEISADCQKNKPMLRLLQGDVGSGKTIVAAYCALLAVSSQYQVVLMSPTELLAEQHYHNFKNWFADFNFTIIYLSSAIKGKARQKLISQISQGSAQIMIGTHALFQHDVEFAQLGLIIIDEQHRFGVHQRLALSAKAKQRPHQLVMTATPIPRTLAMLNYADLDISIIDELPPNRQRITTRVLPAERRAEIIERIQHWIEQRQQVYWVCTLITESEKLQAESAEQTAQQLSSALPSARIGLIHGRLKANQKEAVMLAFKNGEIDLLVATTVIEVGVDVPNANLMIIENPERLGLAQLHQLRGRIGRGNSASYCLLLYSPPLSALTKQRLAIIRDHTDGFSIAEQDLQLRGAGELLGTKQTGLLKLKIADMERDQLLINEIQATANKLIISADMLALLQKRWLPQGEHYISV